MTKSGNGADARKKRVWTGGSSTLSAQRLRGREIAPRDVLGVKGGEALLGQSQERRRACSS